MHATKAAVEEGIVPGGGVALLRAAKGAPDAQARRRRADRRQHHHPGDRGADALDRDQRRHEGSIVVQRVKEMKDEEGFNAQTEQYENLVKAGVIDPTKVVRSALQNAASIASLLLTTEAVISQMPEDHKARPRRTAAAWAEGCTSGMGPLRELLATDHRQALEFFFLRLKDVSGPDVDRTGAALQRQRAGALRPGLDAGRRRAAGAGEPQRGLRPFRVRHDAAARQPDDGNGGGAMPAAGGVLRGSDAPAAQHPLVCRARRRVSSAGRRRRNARRSKARLLDTHRHGASSPGASATRGSAASCATSPSCWCHPGQPAPQAREALFRGPPRENRHLPTLGRACRHRHHDSKKRSPRSGGCSRRLRGCGSPLRIRPAWRVLIARSAECYFGCSPLPVFSSGGRAGCSSVARQTSRR